MAFLIRDTAEVCIFDYGVNYMTLYMYNNLQDALKKLLLKYAMKGGRTKPTLEIKLHVSDRIRHKSIKEYRSPENQVIQNMHIIGDRSSTCLTES